MARAVSLDITLTPAQEQIDACESRFVSVEAGRRTGKTRYSLFWLIKRAGVRGTTNWLVAPTYRLAKEVAWRELQQMLPDALVKRRHETELTVELVNGSIIALKGSDYPDALRGRKLWSVVMEEAAYQKEYIWRDIVRPGLADLQGSALFISTPNGHNWFHKQHVMAGEGKDAEWSAFHFTIYDNPHIDRAEIARIKAETTEMTWRQEYMAEVLACKGLIYPEFSDKHIFMPGEKWPGCEEWPLVRGIDWGLEDDTACAFLNVHEKGPVLVTDEYSRNGADVRSHVEAIVRMTGRRKPVADVLDRSAFRNEGTSMTSISKQFARDGIRCIPSESDQGIQIDTMKRFLASFKNGVPALAVSVKCRRLIKAFQETEYDQHEPDILAATRYALAHIYRKQMTSILDGAEMVGSARQDDSESVSLAGRRLLPSRRRSGPVAWDFDNGVPA